MKQELHHDGSDALYETVLKLRNTDECRAFFEDICSPHELRTIDARYGRWCSSPSTTSG